MAHFSPRFKTFMNHCCKQNTFLFKQVLSYLNEVAKFEAPLRRASSIASNGNRLTDPLPSGVILTDGREQKWNLGKLIGVSGSGNIYLASDDIKETPGPDAKFAIKVEHCDNWTWFTEANCYLNDNQPKQINEWMQKKKLSFLGFPKYLGAGSHEHESIKYLFIVMERFGEDLQTVLAKNRKVFPIKTVYTLGKLILDILEYIHSHGYIHADVKASNLLMGYGPGKENEVYLIDFGLARRYVINGEHIELKEDKTRAHDGTIVLTSRDAHIGAHSRRGDLEILGYNMLLWLCGHLPWGKVKKPESVRRQKYMYLSDIPTLMKKCFEIEVPSGIAEYFSYVAHLTFEEEPDYRQCKSILSEAIKAHGFEDDGILVYTSPKIKRKNKKRPAENESSSSSPPAKVTNMVSENTGALPPQVWDLIKEINRQK